MRKLLLGTSALIGATALVASASAAAPELTISGNLNFEWQGGENQAFNATNGNASEDRGAGESGWNFAQANSLSEIKFFAEGESDGGLTYGADVQYRYLGSSTDEAYIFVSGDWGTIHLGQDDGAVNQTRFYAGSIAPGGYLIDGNATYLAPKSINAYSDANKILYVSNDLSGFKFALSIEEAGDAEAATSTRQDGVATVRTARATLAGSATAAATRTNQAALNTAINTAADADATAALFGSVQYEDQYEIGASYTADFGDGSFGVSVGYQTADVADNSSGPEVEDREEYIVGFKAGFGPISLAGSYADAGESGLTNIEQSNGAEAAKTTTLGIAYDLGGGMAVGVSYAERESTAVAAAGLASVARVEGEYRTETTDELITIDFGFPIMEGMSGYAGIAFSEREVATSTVGSTVADGFVAGTPTSNDATTYVIGTTVSF